MVALNTTARPSAPLLSLSKYEKILPITRRNTILAIVLPVVFFYNLFIAQWKFLSCRALCNPHTNEIIYR